MTRKILCFIFTFIALYSNAQNINKKIEQLMELDGTISKVKGIVNKTIEVQKIGNSEVSDTYWKALENKILEESIVDFKSIMIPIYKEVYTDSEIEKLINLFNSDLGKLLSKMTPKALEKQHLALVAWSQNLNASIIKEIETRGKKESSSEEIEKFKSDFIKKYGLQILNLNELAIDQENNVGSLLIDFGKLDGTKNIVKVIRVKNNSNQEITFRKTFFLEDRDPIQVDLGQTPLKKGETRDLKITLNADIAEGIQYRSLIISSKEGTTIPLGVKFDIPNKEIMYKVSKDTLKMTKVKRGEVSKPYIFTIKNTGTKGFFISDIKLDKEIAYLHYSKKEVLPNQQIEIRVIVTDYLMNQEKAFNSKLDLNVELSEGNSFHFSHFPSKTINLKIR